jgi:hypothetical protein
MGGGLATHPPTRLRVARSHPDPAQGRRRGPDEHSDAVELYLTSPEDDRRPLTSRPFEQRREQ